MTFLSSKIKKKKSQKSEKQEDKHTTGIVVSHHDETSATATATATIPNTSSSSFSHNHPPSMSNTNATVLTSKHTISIGSRSSLTRSPDQRSILLSPLSPKPMVGTKALLQDSTTSSPIFRQDVREEWIDAIFGKDFFPRRHNDDGRGMSAMEYTPPREGMGLAKIPSFLSYTVTIVHPEKCAKEGGELEKKKEETKSFSVGKKVGVTLSRIPIGVYARMVDLESEAYAAGVVPGSILVDINGMGVLGEPSHKLLERLWIYEGHFRNVQCKEGMMKNGSGGPNGDGNYSFSMEDSKEDGKRANGAGVMGRKKLTPVILTWIKDGQLYTTVLMAGSPFGISWAPCGNFALVQRAYSFAQKAGVRRGCIVAAVNHKSMRDMDHLDTAIELKEQFSKGRDIRIVCIYTPAASRTNYFKNNKSANGNVMKSIANDFKSIDGVKVRRVDPSKRLPQVENPTEYGVGSFFTCGTGANYAPVTSSSEDDLISNLANSVAAGEIAAPTGMKVGFSNLGNNRKTVKASFEQILSEKLLADERSLSRSLRELERKYDDFPTVSWSDIIAQWNFLDAITFCTRMYAAAYNEENFISMGGVIGGSEDGQTSVCVTKNAAMSQTIPLHSTPANLVLLKSIRTFPDAPEIFQSYLLQMIAFVSSEQSYNFVDCEVDGVMDKKTASERAKAVANKVRRDMIEIIVEMALHDDDLCQTLHFLLRSFSSTYARLKLTSGSETLNAAHQYLKTRLLEVENSDTIMPSLNSPSSVSYDGIYESGSLISPSWTSHQSTYESSPNAVASKKTLRKKLGKKMAKMFRNRNANNIEEDSEVSVSVAPSESVEVESVSSSQKQMANKKRVGFMPTSILRKAVDQTPQDDHFGVVPISEIPSTPELFENMGWFLSNLDNLCGNIERSLLKSFSQKVTNWALQPWSDSKHRALAESTTEMRNMLRELNLKDSFNNEKRHWSPVLNPMDATEILLSVVPEESYILPSAHFPLLLSFYSRPNPRHHVGMKNASLSERGELHRIQVKVVSAQGDEKGNENVNYLVYAALGGTIKNTGQSTLEPYYGSITHRWHGDNELEFESRLANFPRTLEIKVCSIVGDSIDEHNTLEEKDVYASTEIGFAFVDISNGWTSDGPQMSRQLVEVLANNSTLNFDQSGNFMEDESLVSKALTVELEIITESFPLLYARDKGTDSGLRQRRMLLYKHDEDMRQEMLAIQFLDTCDRILKASGLDLKMKKYKCLSVGENKGFVEWVPGAVSLSEICKAGGKDSSGPTDDQKKISNDSLKSADAGLDDKSTKFVRTGAWCKHESLRDLRRDPIGLSGYNPIQDFLRSNAYDPDGPYFVHRDVMDNYVKSCAGYCVITYLLGVGDRHTDNLLLHPEGHFLHCDFSFILGRDPKTFLPMRITQHMVNGMGGRESDNFAKFLSLAGAAFVSLRQPASVRILMSVIQGMVHSNISDISVSQNPEEALRFAHDRFCLDLSDDDAVAFLEENIERSLSSKIWLAVDAIHSIGKRF